MVNVGALAGNASLLPFLLDTGNASTDPLASPTLDPAAMRVQDLFDQVVANFEQEGSQSQTLLGSVTSAHTLLSAAQPLMPGRSSVFGTGVIPSAPPVDSAAQALVAALNKILGSSAPSAALPGISDFLDAQSAALAGIGITQGPSGSGTLILDQTQLNSALSTNPAGVQELLGGAGLAGVVATGANALLGQALGFSGPLPAGLTPFQLLASTPGLLVNLLA
jgi:hypothetical protein